MRRVLTGRRRIHAPDRRHLAVGPLRMPRTQHRLGEQFVLRVERASVRALAAVPTNPLELYAGMTTLTANPVSSVFALSFIFWSHYEEIRSRDNGLDNRP